MIINFVEAGILLLFSSHLISVFTSEPGVIKLGTDAIYFMIFAIFLDFWQAVLYGAIVALGQ